MEAVPQESAFGLVFATIKKKMVDGLGDLTEGA